MWKCPCDGLLSVWNISYFFFFYLFFFVQTCKMLDVRKLVELISRTEPSLIAMVK